jgi:acyl-CoA synthetase (AMP-forming)/AMP-acid ligase II
MMDNTKTAAKSFHRVLADHARERPDKIFVHGIEQDKLLTFRALYSLSNRFAHFLEDRELGANDRVLLLAENSVEFLAVFAATLRYGATIATVHVEMNHAHLAEIIDAIAPKIVLYQDGLGLESVLAGLPGSKFRVGDWQEGGGSTATTWKAAPVRTIRASSSIPPAQWRSPRA